MATWLLLVCKACGHEWNGVEGERCGYCRGEGIAHPDADSDHPLGCDRNGHPLKPTD